MSLVAVVKADQRSVGVPLMQTRSGSPRARCWNLTLECGHQIERGVRYQKGSQPRGWGCIWSPPPLTKMLPAPKKIKCPICAQKPSKKG